MGESHLLVFSRLGCLLMTDATVTGNVPYFSDLSLLFALMFLESLYYFFF